MTKVQKEISKYNLIEQIGNDYVTYLFKLNDGRLCVCCHKEMKIFKYSNNTFFKQLSIPDLDGSITKIIQLKNDLVIFPTKDNDINLIKVFEDKYEVHHTIKLDKKIVKKIQKYIEFVELKDNKIAVLVYNFGDDKILIYNNNVNNYEIITVVKLPNLKYNLSLDIVEIPKLNQIAYYSNRGLFFYDLPNFELKKSISSAYGFEWTNTMVLYNEDYLLLGSQYASCNENNNSLYLVKCSTYEIVDKIFTKDLDFMFCTSMKILSDNTILCGFHAYDSISKYVHLKVENEKIKIIGFKKLSDQQYDGEICGIEQFDNIIVAGNRNNSILVYS